MLVPDKIITLSLLLREYESPLRHYAHVWLSRDMLTTSEHEITGAALKWTDFLLVVSAVIGVCLRLVSTFSSLLGLGISCEYSSINVISLTQSSSASSKWKSVNSSLNMVSLMWQCSPMFVFCFHSTPKSYWPSCFKRCPRLRRSIAISLSQFVNLTSISCLLSISDVVLTLQVVSKYRHRPVSMKSKSSNPRHTEICCYWCLKCSKSLNQGQAGDNAGILLRVSGTWANRTWTSHIKPGSIKPHKKFWSRSLRPQERRRWTTHSFLQGLQPQFYSSELTDANWLFYRASSWCRRWLCPGDDNIKFLVERLGCGIAMEKSTPDLAIREGE